jgi:hypothetical protein
MKANEVRSLNASIDSLKSVNEELKARYSIMMKSYAANIVSCSAPLLLRLLVSKVEKI